MESRRASGSNPGVIVGFQGPLIIVVSGAPCTGKTTLGRRIAQEFRLPFLSKDAFKESLSDTLGRGDLEWSKKLGVASIMLLFEQIATQLE